MGCHSDVNPNDYTPVGEHVLPSYYFTPDAVHPDKPTDPCNSDGGEDRAGSTAGLDNDGDALHDADDPDCAAGCGSDAECSDGEFCNGTEVCIGGTCFTGTPVDRNDGVGCTVDSYNEGTRSCDNIPDDTVCDNGLYFDGAEWCDPVTDCTSRGDPCPPGATGNEETDTCDQSTGDDCVRSYRHWRRVHDDWPTDHMVLGDVLYAQSELLAILMRGHRRNGLVKLVREVIAVDLNSLAGASVPGEVHDTLLLAHAMIGNLVIPPIGDGFLSHEGTETLEETLDAYNKGRLPGGPVACDDDEHEDSETSEAGSGISRGIRQGRRLPS